MTRSTVWAATALVASLAGTGCGSSSHPSKPKIADAKVITDTSTAGSKTFRAQGIGLRFSYPKSFRPVPLGQTKKVVGSDLKASHAAIGVSRYDLIVVTRFRGLPIPITKDNIARYASVFRKDIAQLAGHDEPPQITAINGLPTLDFPPFPVSGVPVPVTSHILNVFIGSDEYEINCQATAAHKAAIDRECAELRTTLKSG